MPIDTISSERMCTEIFKVWQNFCTRNVVYFQV